MINISENTTQTQENVTLDIVQLDNALTVLNEETVDEGKTVSFYTQIAVDSIWNSAVYKLYFATKSLNQPDNTPEFIEAREAAQQDALAMISYVFKDCGYIPAGDSALSEILLNIDDAVDFDTYLAEELMNNWPEYRSYGANDDMSLEDAKKVFDNIPNDIDAELVRSALFYTLDPDYVAEHALDFETPELQSLISDSCGAIGLDSTKWSKDILKNLQEYDLAVIGEVHEETLKQFMHIRPQADLKEIVEGNVSNELNTQSIAKAHIAKEIDQAELLPSNFHPSGEYIYIRVVKLMESVERSLTKAKHAYRKARNNRSTNSFKRANAQARYEGLNKALEYIRTILAQAEQVENSNTMPEFSKLIEAGDKEFAHTNLDMPAKFEEPNKYNGGMQPMV